MINQTDATLADLVESTQQATIKAARVTMRAAGVMSSATKEASQSSTLVGLALAFMGLGAWALFFLEIGKIFFDGFYVRSVILLFFSAAGSLLVLIVVFKRKDSLLSLFTGKQGKSDPADHGAQ